MNISEIGTRAFRIEKEIPLGVGNFSNFLVRIENCPWNVVESSSHRISDIAFLQNFSFLPRANRSEQQFAKDNDRNRPIFHPISNERNYCNIIR